MEQVEVSLADIARIAGVRPSAVSNWRRRRDDFPAPVGGTDRSPRFDLAEVEGWLSREGKASEIPADERLWQAFDTARGALPPVDALASAGVLVSYMRAHPRTVVPRDPEALSRLMAKAQRSLVFDGHPVAAELTALLGPSELGARELMLLQAVAEAAAEGDPAQTFEYLCSRYLDTGSRAGPAATPPELAEIMLDLAGPGHGRLFDPACGSGTVLLAAARRGYTRVEGQEVNSSLAGVAALRLTLAEHRAYDVRAGDSLRHDAYPLRSADAVVCNPPFADRNWGLDELAEDSRWEYEVPSRLESELAWVQHALAHAVPGGAVVMLVPPAVAARPSGRRVRSNLVRHGALRAVISLPPGLAAYYALALQIWVLERPEKMESPPDVLFIDVSGFSANQTHRGGAHPAADAPAWDEVRRLIDRTWATYLSDPANLRDFSDVALAVPVVDLLDDEVDLTPGRQLLAAKTLRVSRDDLAETHARMSEIIARLAELLPTLPNSGPGPGEDEAIREAPLEELAQMGAIFIRRAMRPPNDKEAGPRLRARILTGRDIARATPPSEVAEVIADEVRNPPIRAGDVLVPLAGRRLIARVATELDVGAYLSPTVFLIRPDPATIDPWFLAGLLSSSDGGRQAARMASTLGENVRFDPRRVRVPLLPIDRQRVYGEAFRLLWEFARTLRATHDLGIDFVWDMLDVTAEPLRQTHHQEESPRSVRATLGREQEAEPHLLAYLHYEQEDSK